MRSKVSFPGGMAKADVKSVVAGAVLATLGASGVSVANSVWGFDFGQHAEWAGAALAVAANILRKSWSRWAGPTLALFFLATGAGKASAQATASEFSHGPTVPMFTVRFDDTGNHGGAHGGMLNAGAGYSFNFNFAPTADGSIRRFTLGVPTFLSFQGGDPSNFSFATGFTFGTFNNLVAIGAAVDLVDVNADPAGVDRGLLLGDFGKENVMILISFGLNLGGGATPAPSGSSKAALAAAKAQTPPPCYFKCW